MLRADMEVPANTGGRDALVAMLLAVAGLAVVLPILARVWPSGFLPPDTGRPDYAYNVSILKLMLCLEGAGWIALAGFVAWRGTWIRAVGGVAFLDRYATVALAAVGLAHAIAFCFFFPPQQILSPEPVHSGLHAPHFYSAFAAHRLLAQGGQLWGYDPFFLAGYPAGAVFDPDTRGAELWAHVFAFAGLVPATKSFILFVHALVPVCVYAAARILGIERGAAVASTFLVVCTWHAGQPFIGILRWAGMHSYLLACLLALVGIACCVRFFDRDHRVRAACCIAATGVAALLGWIQPAGLVLFAPAAGLACLCGATGLRRRDVVAIALAAIVLAGVHAAWIGPLWRQRDLLAPASPALQLDGVKELLAAFARRGALPAIATMLLGGAGLWIERHRRPLVTAVLAGTAIVIAIAAAYGVHVPGLRRLETARLAIGLPLVLAPMAGIALRRSLDVLQQAVGRPLAWTALCIACTVPPFLGLLDARFFGVHRLDATLDPGFAEVVQALETSTPEDARLLFESTSGAPTQISTGASLQALLPLYLRRELVGAPMPGLALRHARLDFGGGLLASTPLAQWTNDSFQRFLHRYHVGGVAAWSPAARSFLGRQADALELVATVRGFDVYRVRVPNTFVARGAARVRADYGRIEVDAIAADTLDLRYHWMKGMQAAPSIPIEQWKDPADPIGFIRLRPGGVRHVVLRTGR